MRVENGIRDNIPLTQMNEITDLLWNGDQNLGHAKENARCIADNVLTSDEQSRKCKPKLQNS